MKLLADIQGEKRSVEIKKEGERVFAKVEDRVYELEASEVEPNVYLFKHDNRIYEVYVSPNNVVHIGNHQIEVNITDPKRLRGSASARLSDDGVVEIKTAMPGKVVRVLVKKGDTIKRGEGVIVVEAMKMQNEMKSPKDGIVKEVRFSEGDAVNAGEVLAVIE